MESVILKLCQDNLHTDDLGLQFGFKEGLSYTNAVFVCRSTIHYKMFVSLMNKNLAIANRSRVSCINTNNNTMTLKSGLEVTQGH